MGADWIALYFATPFCHAGMWLGGSSSGDREALLTLILSSASARARLSRRAALRPKSARHRPCVRVARSA